MRLKLAWGWSWLALALLPAVRGEDRFVAPLPAPVQVDVRNGAYAHPESGELRFDLYRPAGRSGRVPVVVFLNGIGADGMRSHPQYVGWARAVAARGLAGVTMDSHEGAIEENLRALLHHLETRADELGVDSGRVALWSCSANVRAGLPLSQSLEGLAPAVVYYGTGEVESFRRDRPLLVARAGLDNADLNREIDAWVERALASNAPIEVLNLPGAPHGFDVRLDSELSRAAIERTLDFLERALATDWVAAVDAEVLRSAAA